MPTSKELLEKKGELYTHIRRLREIANNEKRKWTAEEETNWTRLNSDYDATEAQLQEALREERMTYLDGQMTASAPTPSGSGLSRDPDTAPLDRRASNYALKAWAGYRPGRDSNPLFVRAAQRMGINHEAKEIEFRWTPVEQRDQLVGTPSLGGYTVPQGFMANLETAMLYYGGMRQAGSIVVTDSGNDIPWPTVNDTTQTGAFIGEGSAVTEQDVTIGQKILKAFKYTSKLVQVSFELIQDSAFNIEVELGKLLGQRLGRILNTEFTNGIGTTRPQGITNASAAGLGETSETIATLKSDDVIDLQHSVDIAYRNNPKAAFMMHDLILAAVRKLKEATTNAYIWQPGLQAGVPDLLLSKPYFINNDMSSTVATGNKVMLFGDFDAYKIRDVGSIRVRRLDERYADNDLVGFVAFSRNDGQLIEGGVKPVKYLIIQ